MMIKQVYLIWGRKMIGATRFGSRRLRGRLWRDFNWPSLIGITSWILAYSSAQASVQFRSIGSLGGGGTTVAGISGDGLTVVGNSFTSSGAKHAFVWTQNSGVQDLSLSCGQPSFQASGVSADGSTIVGAFLNA